MQLIIRDLNKQYANGVKALNNVSLSLDKGMFGLLGPNGAGKSTLMRTIAALQDPDSGSITLGDIDVINQKNELRKVLGYLPQDFGFYPKVSALDMLDHFAVLKGISNRKERKEIVEALLQQTNLFEVRKRYLKDFSGGMRQRFGIAQALLGNPRLVIVDEPTAGLDPMERNRFHNILSEIGSQVIVILSTHIVDDVKTLCSNMVIMNNGSILLEGSPQSTVDAIRGRVWKKAIIKEELTVYKKEMQVISQHIS
jgi:ABC-type branched-subunit amino acid transport system ATPase component